MNIDIKVTDKEYMPTKATEGSLGFDLYATDVRNVYEEFYVEYDTGVSVALPEGVACLVLPRSSVTNKGLFLGNSVGLIDADYRGTIKLRFYDLYKDSTYYKVGDKIGQMLFVPILDVSLNSTDSLSITDRGIGGFGSTNI